MQVELSSSTSQENMRTKGIWITGMIFCLAFSISPLMAQESPREERSGVSQKENKAVLSQTVEDRRSPEPLLWLGLVLLGICLLVAQQAYRQITQSRAISQPALQKLRQERQRLLHELARLEEQHEKGNVAAQNYVSEPQQRQQQLLELTLLCKTLS